MNCRAPVTPHPVSATRPRNLPLEREIMQLALDASERRNDSGLSEYANRRCLPGGVRTDQDWERHALEEAADMRNYLTWKAEEFWEGYQAGDPYAGEQVARYVGALATLLGLWDGLVRR